MRRALVSATLLVHALILPACSRDLVDTDLFAQPDMSGSVRIPLAASTADGTTYLLRNATVEIGGAAMLTLSSQQASDLNQRRDAITSTLPAGSYTLFLRPGYQLVEVDENGHEHAVDAQLAGQNPTHFALHEFEDATVKLTFAPAGQHENPVVFGVREAVRVTGLY